MYTYLNSLNDDELIDSFRTTNGNISSYVESKINCIYFCRKKKCLGEECWWYIPDIIHLDVMYDKRNELINEMKKRELWVNNDDEM